MPDYYAEREPDVCESCGAPHVLHERTERDRVRGECQYREEPWTE